MMQVEPTCRYCKRRMRLKKITNGRRAIAGAECQLYIYDCVACRSEQVYQENGHCLEWWFTAGKYLLVFWTNPIQFSVFSRVGDTMEVIDKCLLRLHTLPTNLTPQNTSEERVKLLITFS